MIDTYFTDIDPVRWALRILALIALGIGITSLYLLVVPKRPLLHRSVIVLVFACGGTFILLYGVDEPPARAFAFTLLGLAGALAARLRIAEWALAVLAIGAIGVTLSRWVEIFVDAVEKGYADLGGQGDLLHAAVEVYFPTLILACIAGRRLRPPFPAPSPRDNETNCRQPSGGP
jgi:hypothetical protein